MKKLIKLGESVKGKGKQINWLFVELFYGISYNRWRENKFRKLEIICRHLEVYSLMGMGKKINTRMLRLYSKLSDVLHSGKKVRICHA